MKDLQVVEIFKEPERFSGQEICVSGWIRQNRCSGKIGFIALNDGSCFGNIQIVYESDKIADFDKVSKWRLSAAVMVKGILVKADGAKQAYEILASEVSLLADSESDYPLQKKRHSMEFLREIAHLRPRSNTFQAVFRVRNAASFAIHDFFHGRGFIYAHSPEITCSDCEGAGEMFQVTTLDLENLPLGSDGKIDYTQDFFGKKANLTVSGQLEAEIMALAFRNVYTFGPTFRAENSNTARHASEFWMIEPEMAFCDLQGNMDVAEAMIKHIINYVLEHCKEEMEFFNQYIDSEILARLDNIVNSEFERITYTDAVKILQDSQQKFEYPVEWGLELQTEHERYLTEQVYKKPIFVTNYPKDCKAFYMRVNDDNKTVAACDMLVPGVGEIIGGSQREERYDVLLARIKELGLPPENYSWYLDLRKYGGVKHSGFGLGFDRILMYMTGMSNIRDVQMFPRTPGNAEF